MTTTSVPLPHGGKLTAQQHFVLEAMRESASVYVYGPPGSGKTTLLDAAHAIDTRSIRWHCADFFGTVHRELPRHGRSLEATVASLTGKSRTVFFDEFHVHDVADAIYLDRALRWWAGHRVRVVATSNYPPAELLPSPLLHQAAEPVIARIEGGFEVIELDDGVDHRRYSPPADAGFASGAWLPVVDHGPLGAVAKVNGRSLAVAGPSGSRTLETTFAELCESPWSTADFLALLSDSEAVVVHDVPHPARLGREPGQRLANLVDVAYDQDVPLIVHSGGEAEGLHDSEFPPLDVARTVSRLRVLRVPPTPL